MIVFLSEYDSYKPSDFGGKYTNTPYKVLLKKIKDNVIDLNGIGLIIRPCACYDNCGVNAYTSL